jgi:carbon monoxide dehydrogenase subunit G
MTQSVKYTSREGLLTCTPREVFEFASDLRNFTTLLHENTVTLSEMTSDSCCFNIVPLGDMKVKISRKVPYSLIVYDSELLNIQDLSLDLKINGGEAERTKVIITFNADLNPFMKIMAERHIERLLDKLISEMESFRGWNKL